MLDGARQCSVHRCWAPLITSAWSIGARRQEFGYRRGRGRAGHPAGQPADAGHRPQPPLDLVADRLGGHDDQVVAARSGVFGAGTKASPSRTTRRDGRAAAAGAARTPRRRQPGPSPTCTCSRSASSRVQRGRLDVEVTAPVAGRVTPSRRATQGRVGACTSVKTTTSTKTRSKSCRCPGRPAVSGTVARTIGTAPRSPAQDRNACSRHGTRNGSQRHEHRQRPGDQQQHQADARAPAGSATPARDGVASRPSRTNRPIWASHASALGEPAGRRPGAAAACSPAPARPGRPRGSRCACSTARGRRRRARTAPDRDRVETGGGQRDPAHGAAPRASRPRVRWRRPRPARSR